jgi:soluble lytic murein transglycosylase-like protein
VKRQIGRESQFNPEMLGGKGEKGLMQIKPDTRDEVVNKLQLPQGDLYDSDYNLKVGIGYLSIIRDELRKQDDSYKWSIATVERWKLIFAGYNAGYPTIIQERDKKAQMVTPTAPRPKGLPSATPTECPPVPPVLWVHIQKSVDPAGDVDKYVGAIMGDWSTSPAPEKQPK